MSAAFAHAVLHFIVRQHGAQRGTPVHPSFTEVGDAEAHQDLALALFIEALPLFSSESGERFILFVAGDSAVIGAVPTVLLETLDQFVDGPCLVLLVIVPAIEELQEDPLRPL